MRNCRDSRSGQNSGKNIVCSIAYYLAALLVAVQVSGCGGSSDPGPQTSPPPAAPGPTSQDLENAKAAGLSANLDLSSDTLTLSWKDTFASGYQVEQQTGGAWTTLETLPGQQGSQKQIVWTRAISTATIFRVQATLSAYAVPLATPSQQNQILVAPPNTLPSIAVNQSEPISGKVGVSISGGGTYSSVNYYLDLNPLASSAIAPDYPITMDTADLTAGSHLLLATLQTSPDLYLEIRRVVQVANPQVAVRLSVSDSRHVNVVATSDFGIQTVTAAIDGASLGSLSTPNAGSNTYQFTVDPAHAVSGTHTVTAQATDGSGNTDSATSTVTFDNAPVLAVTSPFDGMLVNGTLHLAGTFTTDKPGGVTLRATLGSVPILTTTTSPFSADYSLAGVSPGSYTATLTATDSTQSKAIQTAVVTVTSSGDLVHAPTLALGQFGQLLAVDQATMLYRLQDDSASVHLRSGATDRTLDTSGIAPSQWQLSSGHAFALGLGVSPNLDVYHWAPDGTRQDLGALGPSNLLARLRAAHWPWVLASDGIPNNQVTGFTPLYLFYNALTGQTIAPTLPNASLIFANADFYVSQTGLTLYYPADLSANPGFNPIGISRWDQSTTQSTPIAIGNLWQINQQTDGTRVAWQTGAPGGEAPFNLVALDIASEAQQTLSTTLSPSPTQYRSGHFWLADGLLTWAESSPTSAAIKVSDGTTVTTVSSRISGHLYGTGGGYVLFGEDAKLYVWSAAGGRQLVLDVTPGVARISGKTIYFTNGVQQALYSVTLN